MPTFATPGPIAATVQVAGAPVYNFVSPPGNSRPSDYKVMVHARTRHGDVIIRRAAS